ncbi:MAG: hypothetical protein HY569_00725 [Candidatus Magasanikbacteria bacterium]|nr:hypothetical protein [Candidatus Magasanikbacteria bacterium]
MFDIYTILPLTCAIFVAFFGVFVLLNDEKSRMHHLLFGFCMSMMFWMFGTFMMFYTRGNYYEAIFWDRFVYAGVVFMPPLMHHFSLVFTGRVGKQKFLLTMNYILAFAALVASRTPYFLDDLYYYSWGVHTQARILHTVFLGYFFLGTGVFFYNVFSYFKKAKDKIVRLQSIYVFISFAVVIFVGGSAYLFAYGIDTKFPFAYLSGLIFPVMLFYSVSRHHLLGAKTIATEVLVGLTEFVVVMEMFFSRDVLELTLRVFFALVVAAIGILLIKSVRSEVARREEVTSLAKSLEQANLRLQEIDRQKTEFMSIASHQLRTPLSILKGFIELIEDGAYGKPTEKMVEALNQMDQSNEHLVKLVDEFLDVTRIEQGRTKYDFTRCDLKDLVSGAVNEMRERAVAKKLKLVWCPPPEAVSVNCDQEKIHHIIFNFIDNAIKYSERGRITVCLRREDGGVAIKVKDCGIGFDKVDEANFFQKFYRGENVKNSNVTGTGLGLYVCNKFVEAHHGRVWAKSAGLGKGSEFGFWIPQ